MTHKLWRRLGLVTPEPRADAKPVPDTGDAAKARALAAALAEFASIRARMDVFAQAQVTVFTAGVTGIGVIASFALKERGDQDLMLFISLLAPILICTHSDLRNRIGHNGAYIGVYLWPHIQALTDDPELPSWESNWERRVGGLLQLVGVSQAVVLLAAASAGALIDRWHAVYEHNGHEYIWVAGAVLTFLSLVYSGWVFASIRLAKKAIPSGANGASA